MQTPEHDGPVNPLLIYDATGALCLSGLINTKGYNKSLENGLPWVLDGLTGRLVPLADQSSIFAQALVDAGRAANARCLAAIERHGNAVVARLDLALQLRISGVEGPVEPTVAKTMTSATAPLDKEYTATERTELAGFLFHLQDLIRQRKFDLPEGSYTTHLFKSGSSKIRKKTGEEAVELILAKDAAEIAAEASDLIYHMMVLFADSNVSIEQVLEELKKR